MGLLGCVACGLSFTPPFLCNKAYINKIGLSPSIFVPSPLEVSYMVRSQDIVRELWFVNLMLPSDLCARMLSLLGANIYKASRVRSKDAWLVGSHDS